MVVPDSDDFIAEERPVFPPRDAVPLPPRRAPEWLAGPDEDMLAAGDQRENLPTPQLSRPGDGAGPPRPRERRPLELVPPLAAQAARETQEPAPAPAPAPWAPAASSVPMLKLVLPENPPTAAGPAVGAATVIPPGGPGLPGSEEDAAQTPAAPPVAALREDWWLVALDTLRTSRRAQVSVAGGLLALVLLGFWMWPRGVGSTPLSQVRRNPRQYDGRSVVVRGRVGDDVFAVGGGWAFYLMQGRDTIVTFTRQQAPKPRSVVTVSGQVSTGFLDGVPRQALFVEPPPPEKK